MKKSPEQPKKETLDIEPSVDILSDFIIESKPEVKPEDPGVVQKEIKKIKQEIGLWDSGEQIAKPEDEKGLFSTLRKGVQRFVNESRLPNEDYKSTVGVYGGKMKYDEEGRMIYDRRGVVSKVDTFGDGVFKVF